MKFPKNFIVAAGSGSHSNFIFSLSLAGYTLFANHYKTWVKPQNWYASQIVCRRWFIVFCETWFVLFHQASNLHDELEEIFPANLRSLTPVRNFGQSMNSVWHGFCRVSWTYNFFGKTFVSPRFCSGLRIVCSPLLFSFSIIA